MPETHHKNDDDNVSGIMGWYIGGCIILQLMTIYFVI